jgi:hypothetical protein
MENKEDRKERFLRIATNRTNEVLEKLRILGNCYNKSSYDYNEEDINKIFSAIDKTIKETKARFIIKKKKKKFSF